MDYKTKIGKVATVLMFLAIVNTVSAQVSYERMSTPIRNVICGIYGVLYNLVVVIAAVVIIIAIVQFIYHRDDPAKRKAAKEIMIHAIIGIIIAAITNAIITSIGYVRSCVV